MYSHRCQNRAFDSSAGLISESNSRSFLAKGLRPGGGTQQKNPSRSKAYMLWANHNSSLTTTPGTCKFSRSAPTHKHNTVTYCQTLRCLRHSTFSISCRRLVVLFITGNRFQLSILTKSRAHRDPTDTNRSSDVNLDSQ
jgi:hypothetical protein